MVRESKTGENTHPPNWKGKLASDGLGGFQLLASDGKIICTGNMD